MRILLLLALLAARPALACVPLGDSCGPDTGGATGGGTTGGLGRCGACLTLFAGPSLAAALFYDVSWVIGGASMSREEPAWWHDVGIGGGAILVASTGAWAVLNRRDRGLALGLGISAGAIGLPALGLGAYGRLHLTPAPVTGPAGHTAPGIVVGARF